MKKEEMTTIKYEELINAQWKTANLNTILIFFFWFYEQ